MDLEILAGRQFTPTELTINIICRNCADKNETIVNKVNLVTNSLKTGHEAIAAQKESGTSTKRLSSDASGSSSKRSLLLQDAPQKQTSSEQEFMLLTRDASTQARVGQGFWVYGIQGLFKSGIRYISAEIWVFGISCFLNFRYKVYLPFLSL